MPVSWINRILVVPSYHRHMRERVPVAELRDPLHRSIYLLDDPPDRLDLLSLSQRCQPQRLIRFDHRLPEGNSHVSRPIRPPRWKRQTSPVHTLTCLRALHYIPKIRTSLAFSTTQTAWSLFAQPMIIIRLGLVDLQLTVT